MKPQVGLLCGRFQPVHRGHIELVREALLHCEHLIIVIGSAQESNTKRNPFDFETRKELLRRCLRGHNKYITIIGVNDREEVADDSGWGDYLLAEVERQTGLVPTINFTGTEEVRSHWFDNASIVSMEVNRNNLPISATALREAILKDDYNTFALLAPTGLWLRYEFLRQRLEKIYHD